MGGNEVFLKPVCFCMEGHSIKLLRLLCWSIGSPSTPRNILLLPFGLHRDRVLVAAGNVEPTFAEQGSVRRPT